MNPLKWLRNRFLKRGSSVLYDDLTLAHFHQHPIWLASHIHDYLDPAYADEEEEAMRPWDGDYPAPMNISGDVLAKFTAANGVQFDGIITYWHKPKEGEERTIDGETSHFRSTKTENEDVIEYAPYLFARNGERIQFWHANVDDYKGKYTKILTAMETFYYEMGPDREAMFPIQFRVSEEVLAEPLEGTIPGFGFWRMTTKPEYLT